MLSLSHILYLIWCQWGHCAAFGRCFFLMPICGHWMKQMINTWVLGSDASAMLINVSLILAVLHYDVCACTVLCVRMCVCMCMCACVCVYVCQVCVCLCTLACMCVNEYTWISSANYFECSWRQGYMQHSAIHSLSDNCLRCTIAHCNLSFIPNYCFPEVERDRGREGKGEEEIYVLWWQRTTHTNGS